MPMVSSVKAPARRTGSRNLRVASGVAASLVASGVPVTSVALGVPSLPGWPRGRVGLSRFGRRSSSWLQVPVALRGFSTGHLFRGFWVPALLLWPRCAGLSGVLSRGSGKWVTSMVASGASALADRWCPGHSRGDLFRGLWCSVLSVAPV